MVFRFRRIRPKDKRVHLFVVDKIDTACGTPYHLTMRVTGNPSKVTCKRCRKAI